MYLEAEDLWLDERERLAVNLDKTLSGLFRTPKSVFAHFAVDLSHLRTLHWATAVAVFFLPKH